MFDKAALRPQEKDAKRPPQNDEEWLGKAYDLPEGVVVHGDTMYIAGTKSLRDVADDLLIPLHLTNHAERYKNAAELLAKHPEVKTVVGHSLGGSVALELASRFNKETRTYGAPVMSTTSGQRYAHYGDPISMLDFGAQRSMHFPNPHSRSGFGWVSY